MKTNSKGREVYKIKSKCPPSLRSKDSITKRVGNIKTEIGNIKELFVSTSTKYIIFENLHF